MQLGSCCGCSRCCRRVGAVALGRSNRLINVEFLLPSQCLVNYVYFIFYVSVLVQHKLDLIKDKFTVYMFLATLIARNCMKMVKVSVMRSLY